MSDNATLNPEIVKEIEQDITDNKIMVYGKGTKEAPRCGFTMTTTQFFNELGFPFELQDVLDNPEKRQTLNEYANWPTLPKIFINKKFYGDLDIINEMIQSGEFKQVLKEAFPDAESLQ